MVKVSFISCCLVDDAEIAVSDGQTQKESRLVSGESQGAQHHVGV
jgi:hypothetical protein